MNIESFLKQITESSASSIKSEAALQGAVDLARSSKEILMFSTSPCLGFWCSIPASVIEDIQVVGSVSCSHVTYPVVDLHLNLAEGVNKALVEALRTTHAHKGTCACSGSSGEHPAPSAPEVKAGEVVAVCAGQIQPGWVLVNVGTDFTRCGGNWDNIWYIQNLNGMPIDSVVTCCAGSQVPPGWVVTGVGTDFTRCGRSQSFNNLKTIRRIS